VVRWLRAHREFPAGVAVEDLGTPGPGLPTWLAGYRAVILVDTALLDAPPGSLHLLDGEAVAGSGCRAGPHDVDLRAALDALALAGEAPRRVRVIATVPASTETGAPLSDPVRRAVPRAGRLVVEELARLGLRCPERVPPLPWSPDWDGTPP